MLKWIRKNIALLLIIAALVGWGLFSVGSRMFGSMATPPGYAYHCFDSGELASNCVYIADPSSTTGWVTNPNMKLEIIHYRSGRRSAAGASGTDASVIVWSGPDPAPCGFKRICYVAATGKTECAIIKLYDASCP
ncbi:MAG TPA: hypothetical protein VJ183_13705 [Chloroflexia bacterium]|nr:hypothetical protein [Chloroflexia bacterium]